VVEFDFKYWFAALQRNIPAVVLQMYVELVMPVFRNPKCNRPSSHFVLLLLIFQIQYYTPYFQIFYSTKSSIQRNYKILPRWVLGLLTPKFKPMACISFHTNEGQG